MFKGLHVRLTLLYLLAALMLIVLVGAGTYGLLNAYFQTTVDLALQHKMSAEFQRLPVAPPPELAAADRAWYTQRGQPQSRPSTIEVTGDHSSGEDDTYDSGRSADDIGAEDAYDGDLAAIFVLALDAQGLKIVMPRVFSPPFAPDRAAVAAALAQGRDLRTIVQRDGSRTRLLTYRVQVAQGPAVLQIGRTLIDQDRVLRRLLFGLLGLGSISALLLSAISWWLVGRALRPAQESWKRQQTFVANASHELRTPLTLLRASAEVVLRSLPTADTDRRTLLDDVLHESDHMSRLVADLLLLSQRNVASLAIERQTIALPALLADMQRQLGRLADERGVRFVVGPARGAAQGDPTRLRQVLLIVLDNALRHTPSGGDIYLESQIAGRHAKITIADTGSGIAPADLPHVFERFYRADSARTSSGSGLGLSIAKELVEAQHGQISIASKPGHGTRVTVILPQG